MLAKTPVNFHHFFLLSDWHSKYIFFFLNETELCKDDFLFLHCKIKQINKTEIESLQNCKIKLKLKVNKILK